MFDGSIRCLVAWRGLHRFTQWKFYIGFARSIKHSDDTFLWRARNVSLSKSQKRRAISCSPCTTASKKNLQLLPTKRSISPPAPSIQKQLVF
nr:MAG TPA: hypothetical protein [Caudoviricetes sp.]